MKLFHFIVRLKYQKTGFFAPPSDPGYLNRIVATENNMIPCFGNDPITYQWRSAAFLVRELRRAGYNVRYVPYIFFAIKKRLETVMAARAKWK